ncbi:MAG: (2Fe-2S)-binding protein [Chloroflexaceae bacterium]|nr:(2Fe-2S)-binding protein [Chloroflexaceae bacterium]
MPQVIINDELMEAMEGEMVLDIARRHGAHIGFACDGRGFCQTCECRVLQGAEELCPPNHIEQRVFNPEALEHGYRLACQAAVCGSGTAQVLTRAEELRRLAAMVVAPPAGTTAGYNLGRVLRSMGVLVAERAMRVPAVLPMILPQLRAMPPHFPGIKNYVNDTKRVLQRTLKDKPNIPT